MTIAKNSSLVIAGFVLSILTAHFGGFRFFTFNLYLSNIAFIVFIVFYPFARTNKFVVTAWNLATGAVLHGAVFISLKDKSQMSVWLVPGISLGVLFLYLVLRYVSVKQLNSQRDARGMSIDNQQIVLLVVVTALTIAAFRIFDAALVDIPNKQRSLFLFGVEIHHITIGVILLLLMDIFGKSLHRRMYWLGLVMQGIGLGMLTDQSVYFAMRQITDDSYRSATSLYGAIVVYVACVSTWLWCKKHN